MSRLHDEIKQSKPFAHLEDEVFLQIVRTADDLMGHHAAQLKPHGLSPSQYNVLRILRGAGKDGHPCGEIASRLIARDPDITRLLDRLEKQGLVERARDDGDRRVVRARITRDGLKTLATLDEPMAAHVRSLLEHLGRKRLEELAALLEAVRAGP